MRYAPYVIKGSFKRLLDPFSTFATAEARPGHGLQPGPGLKVKARGPDRNSWLQPAYNRTAGLQLPEGATFHTLGSRVATTSDRLVNAPLAYV